MNWNFTDYRISRPQSPGTYIWWDKHVGSQIPIKWDGERWRWLNGKAMPEGMVRWYK